VTETVSFAHAEHADLGVLELERFVLELPTVDGAAQLLVLIVSDLPHLYVHSLDDSVHLGAHVGANLVVRSLVTGTKSKEICNRSWSQVVEELKVDSLFYSTVVHSDLCILASLGQVHHLAERVSRQSFIHNVHRIVHIGEAMENVGSELLSSANVLTVVEQDEVVTRVLIENALQLVGDFLDVLLPLGLEELAALTRDDLWVLLLQVLDRGDTLVESGVSDLAGNRDLDGRSVLGGCSCVVHL